MASPELIVAPATAKGRGAIGIVRLSGAGVERISAALLARNLLPRVATLCKFLDERGQAIDQGLALYYPGPHSYTGESMLELQGHGGEVVQALIVRRCVQLGARLAEAGEFTRRAFLNDRIDLAQAEAVADLIEANSEAAARSAMRSLQGAFSKAVGRLLSQLVDLRALVEASMDFPEEGLELVPIQTLTARLGEAQEATEMIFGAAQRGGRLREGAKLVLLGAPNVGKSSLLNCLAGHDAAIVSEIPGTTRDVIREPIVLEGLPFEVLDTAGVRDSQDPIERMGIERTLKAVKQADVILAITDGTAAAPALDHPEGATVIRVVNKIDLRGDLARVEHSAVGAIVHISAKTGAGVELLRQELVRAVGWEAGAEEGAFLARERHLAAIRACKLHLSRAQGLFNARELFAEELRLAQQELGRITGEFTSDDLLGVIFSRFCIGK